MPARTDAHVLRDMVDSARKAIAYIWGLSEDEFYRNELVQDAVAWRVTIIGEAARRVREATRLQVPQLPWKLMTHMRNRLVHEYTNIRLDIVWATVNDDLPELVRVIEEHLARTAPPSGGPTP